jgi:hypothetical protein
MLGHLRPPHGPPPSRGYEEAEEEGGEVPFGGRPLRGGIVGGTGEVPVWGFNLSTLTDSWWPPTLMRKYLEPEQITRYGPE